TSATATSATATATLTNKKSNCHNYLTQTPKTLTTPTRFIAAKAATVTATPQPPLTTTTGAGAGGGGGATASVRSNPKRVNFNLPTTIDESVEQELEQELEQQLELEKMTGNQSLALATSKTTSQYHLARKPHIVFNGTYPIDMPLGQVQKSSSYDPEANADRSDLQRYRSYVLNDYDVIDEDAEGEEQAEEEEDDEDDDDVEEEEEEDDLLYDESYDDERHYYRRQELLNKYGIIATKPEMASSQAQPQHVWSMEELIANPAIPLNYKKMCSEVEQSLSRFENYLDRKKEQPQQQPGGRPGGGGGGASTSTVRTYDIDAPMRALSSKKKL
ncbi:uncharacterized protein Dana_GF26642, partial [Drosophila ananassae]